QDEHPAPLFRGFPVRFSYAWQIGTQPVTIAIQCNRPQAVDDSYRRFLVNRLREEFKLRVPVRLIFRQKSRATPRGSRGARRLTSQSTSARATSALPCCGQASWSA